MIVRCYMLLLLWLQSFVCSCLETCNNSCFNSIIFTKPRASGMSRFIDMEWQQGMGGGVREGGGCKMNSHVLQLH